MGKFGYGDARRLNNSGRIAAAIIFSLYFNTQPPLGRLLARIRILDSGEMCHAR
jgi:hypothetical protein